MTMTPDIRDLFAGRSSYRPILKSETYSYVSNLANIYFLTIFYQNKEVLPTGKWYCLNTVH